MLGIRHDSANRRACRAGRGRATRATQYRGRRRLAVELLEDRTLLSIFTVNDLGDTGTGTGTSGDLRYCITQANATTGDNTINFSVTGTITLESALPDLSNTTGLTDIEGPGASSLTVARNSASGTPGFRIFTVDASVEAQVVGLIIVGGLAANGGGIDNLGTLTITNSTIYNNSATLGLFGHVGGGILNGGTLTVTDSTIANNSASFGGGIANGGTATVTNCTIDENSVGSGNAGGIGNSGILTLTNSTIANNSGGAGGGIDNDGNGTITVTNCTIAYNSASLVGGGQFSFSGTTTLDNTIVALNTHGSSASDIEGTPSGVVSGAYNLIGTGGSGGLTDGTNGNQVGVAIPGLGPLAFYGGPTKTIDLLPGSPAIGTGSNALAIDPSTGLPLNTDQRGAGFPRISGNSVDIGAYEAQPDAGDAIAVVWGSRTAALQTAVDGVRLLPAGRNVDLPWLDINQLPITLAQAQSLTADDVFINSAIGVNYGPITVIGSGTNYTITLAQPVHASDRVTLVLVNPNVSTFIRRIDVLPGDFNDDGVVNSQDMVGIRNEILGLMGAVPTIFGDINGDGVVDINDYNAVRRRIGTRLPPIS
jgi:hypothetical protein